MAKLIGAPALMANLRALRRIAPERTLDDACIAGLTPLRDQTNQNAPRAALRGGAVIAKRRSTGGRHMRVYWVAFRRGIAMRIAHLVELGTAPHSLAKGASRRYGIMQDVPPFHPGTPPHPFFRPAFESTKSMAAREFGKTMWAGLTSVIRGVKK